MQQERRSLAAMPHVSLDSLVTAGPPPLARSSGGAGPLSDGEARAMSSPGVGGPAVTSKRYGLFEQRSSPTQIPKQHGSPLWQGIASLFRRPAMVTLTRSALTLKGTTTTPKRQLSTLQGKVVTLHKQRCGDSGSWAASHDSCCMHICCMHCMQSRGRQG